MRDEQDLILFDLTNLVWRSRSDTPTGIQRVELAYARYLLDNHCRRTRFLVAFPPKALIVPKFAAAQFIAATEAIWGQAHGRAGAGKREHLARFLGADPCAEHGTQPQPSTSRQGKSRLLLGANLLILAALQSVRPRKLESLGTSGKPMTYICVSGSALPGPWISRWLRGNPNISGAFMIHDLIPVTHPEYVRPVMAIRHRRYVERLMQCASTIITNSQFTADRLAQFASETNQIPPRTVVAPLGICPGFAKRRATAEMPPYFVFVGTIEPRKNHILLLQVWQRLVAQHGAAAPRLVLVGKRGWENENILDLLDRGEHLRSHLLECNSLSDDVLVDLIANARALLLPSHVEGYGLPVAEALALGTPVICSDLPPLREIAGDIPEYVDSLAGRGWARTIMDYAKLDSPRRRAQVRRLQGFRAPTWGAHFRIIETALSLSLDAGISHGEVAAIPSSRAARQAWAPVTAANETALGIELRAEKLRTRVRRKAGEI